MLSHLSCQKWDGEDRSHVSTKYEARVRRPLADSRRLTRAERCFVSPSDADVSGQARLAEPGQLTGWKHVSHSACTQLLWTTQQTECSLSHS